MKKFFNYILLFIVPLGFFSGIGFFILYFTDNKNQYGKTVYNDQYIIDFVVSFSLMTFAILYLWKNNFLKKTHPEKR